MSDLDKAAVLVKRMSNVLDQERRDHEALLRQVSDTLDSSEDGDGSPWDEAVQWAYAQDPSLIEVVGRGFHYCRSLVETMRDQFDALAVLLRQEPPMVIPAGGVLRSLMEPVLYACHLLDPGISTSMRLARIIAFGVGDLQGSLETMKTLPYSPEERAALNELLTDDLDKHKSFGFVHHWNKGETKVVGVSFGPDRANVSLKSVELAEEFISDEFHSLYGLLSGATHGRIWFAEGYRADTPLEAARTLVLQTVLLSAVWSKTLCHWGSIEHRPYEVKRRQRTQGLLEGFVSSELEVGNVRFA